MFQFVRGVLSWFVITKLIEILDSPTITPGQKILAKACVDLEIENGLGVFRGQA